MSDEQLTGSAEPAAAADDTKSHLRRVPVFAKLSEEQQSAVGKALQVRSFSAGDVLIRRGQVGTTFFLLKSGTVGFIVDDSGEVKHTYQLAGDFFGEIALMNDQSLCTATAVTKTGCECYVMDKATFDSLLKSSLASSLGWSSTQAKLLESVLKAFDHACRPLKPVAATTTTTSAGNRRMGAPANHINTLELRTIAQTWDVPLQDSDVLRVSSSVAGAAPASPPPRRQLSYERASRASRRAVEVPGVQFVSRTAFEQLMVSAIAGLAYTPTLLDKARAAAAAIDTNGDGRLTVAVLRRLLRQNFEVTLTGEEVELVLGRAEAERVAAASTSLDYNSVIERADAAVKKLQLYGPTTAYLYF